MGLTSINADDYEVMEDLLPWQKLGKMETETGYGSKLTTTKKLKYNGVWHRIYCHCFSNCGSCYILSKGQRIYVD